MRFVSLAAIALALVPRVSAADIYDVTAEVKAVTVYPGIASVIREVSVDLTAGTHTIVVANLPPKLRADFVEIDFVDIQVNENVTIGAVSLETGRLPLPPEANSSSIFVAQREVDGLTELLRQSDASIAQIRLEVQAAEEQIAFLLGVNAIATNPEDVTSVQAMAQMVGEEILELRRKAFVTEQRALAAERDQEADKRALEAALETLDALVSPQVDTATLTFVVDVAEATTVDIDINSIEGDATWAPVYDLRLTSGETPQLVVERSVVVSQNSGQDWNNVDLTLSTAQPSGRLSPYRVNGVLQRIVTESERIVLDPDNLIAAAPVVDRPTNASQSSETVELTRRTPDGVASSYSYPQPVSVPNQVQDLRLPLDALTFDVGLRARAVPAKENAAYRMVSFTNGDEILFRGDARYFVDDVFVGFDNMREIQPGRSAEIGFGVIQGLLTKRSDPIAVLGDSDANQKNETVTMTFENLTTADWDVQVLDSAPYSEQSELDVTYTATPEIAQTQRNGRPGVLEWNINVPAGTAQDIVLDYTMTWADGFRLE